MTHSSEGLSWRTFHHHVETLLHLCQRSAEELPSPSRYPILLKELHQTLQGFITDESAPLNSTELAQRHITELHRLLRLSLRDAALYQSAKAIQLRQQRLQQLNHHIAQIYQHSQALMVLLTKP